MEGEPVSQVNEHVDIDAPVAVVWQLVADIRRHAEFAGPKSITKEVVFDEPLEHGARWVAHEKFGPQRFDAPSEVTSVVPEKELGWTSYPPAKREEDRGRGGRVLWAYRLSPRNGGTRLEHTMEVLEPARGGRSLRLMYAVLRLPARQRRAVLTSLAAIKREAEAGRATG